MKVADLGIMKQLGGGSGNAVRGSQIGRSLPKATTFIGTSTYMSPERIDGKEYSFPSDVWAFGLSLLSVTLGRLPIETQGGYWTILHSIRDAPSPTLPEGKHSEEMKEFIDLCLKRKPEDRASCKQLLKHRFLRKACPEDLTYAQSYDRGKDELNSIIYATHTHIKELKAEAMNRSHDEVPDVATERSLFKIFGDLRNWDSVTILRKVLFGSNQPSQQPKPPPPSSGLSSDAQQPVEVPAERFEHTSAQLNASAAADKIHHSGTATSVPTNKTHRFSRPRLTNLAKQLHLPLDRVIAEAHITCDSLEKQALSEYSD